MEQFIPDGVAECVVYSLETIQIHHYHSELRAHLLCITDLFLQAFIECAAIWKTCNQIGVGFLCHLLMCTGIRDRNGSLIGKQTEQAQLCSGKLSYIGTGEVHYPYDGIIELEWNADDRARPVSWKVFIKRMFCYIFYNDRFPRFHNCISKPSRTRHGNGFRTRSIIV